MRPSAGDRRPPATRIVDALIARRRRHAPGPLDSLTDRERSGLHEMARGLANAGIARAPALSESAVEKHIGAVFAKLGHDEQPHTHRRVAVVLAHLRASGR